MVRLALLLCLLAGSVWPQSFFEKNVKPVLVERCAKCHNADSKLSNFDLTSRAALMRGGKHGVPVAPGEPDKSRLYEWVASGKMPPERKLDPSEVAAIRQWIMEGAPWTGAEVIYSQRPRAGLDWWALKTPRKVEVPRVDGVDHPIDAFLLARLRSKGLDFAPQADNRTLIRRLSYALTGLPPTVADLQQTYEQAVERLLASPQYGERWGRYWLDIVRFGETDGGEHNNERFTAWRYRDYVIDAFNRDKPYDQFVIEQIAGDVLDRRLAPATGFLTAGPWDSVTKKINRDELMRKTIRQDELDDMVTATFATFQGLTVNCARCHDHKFDPIPTRDYYRLTAVFNGAGFGERDMATEEEKKAREVLVAPLRKDLDEVKRQIAAIDDPVRAKLQLAKFKAFDDATRNQPRRIPVNHLWNRVDFPEVTARYLRLAITGHQGKVAKIQRLELTPAGKVITGWQATEEAKEDKPVYLTIDLEQPRPVKEVTWWTDQTNGSRDGYVRVYRLEMSADGKSWSAIRSSLDHMNSVEVELPEVIEAELLPHLSAASAAARRELLARRTGLQKQLDAIPALPTTYGIVTEEFTKTHLLERGSLSRPLEELTPGTLSAIRQMTSDIAPDQDSDGARRLALAKWIANPRNPLTARVMVNRIWAAHFGSGLVNTPSDFGYNGDRPSHPELLDYLAVEFMQNNWSVKWLQRFILSSRAYRQSAQFDQKAHAVDAGNRLIWHMPLKRMDAETLRDSLLAVTGKLDLRGGGPGFLLQKKAEKGSYMHKALDNDGPEVWKRAVYRFVVRGGERVFMDSFDCPDPAVFTPQRSVSNTPVQALTLLNNPFVLRQSGFLAERLQREAGSDVRLQIAKAYELLYQRPPSERETELGARFIRDYSLTLYCRTLLNSNEWIYVP